MESVKVVAEKDLAKLLADLRVHHMEGVWQFVTYKQGVGSKLRSLPRATDSIMLMKEREGMTFIVPAKEDTPVDNRWAWLELTVYSDLQAVGFLAKVADALASAEIPCNAVAAFHHDHLFVPESRAVEAIAAIEALRSLA